jgi:hypothetical protein
VSRAPVTDSKSKPLRDSGLIRDMRLGGAGLRRQHSMVGLKAVSSGERRNVQRTVRVPS